MPLDKFGKHLHHHSIDEYHRSKDDYGFKRSKSTEDEIMRPKIVVSFSGSGKMVPDTNTLLIANKGEAEYYINQYYSGKIVGVTISPFVDVFCNDELWTLVKNNIVVSDQFMIGGDKISFKLKPTFDKPAPFLCELQIQT